MTTSSVVNKTDKTFTVLRNNNYAVAINNVKPAFPLPSPLSDEFHFPFTTSASSCSSSSDMTAHFGSHHYDLRHAPRPTSFSDFVM